MQTTEPSKQEIVNRIPPDVLKNLEMKLGELQSTLLAQDPLMPNHLRESHRLLITYPETVHLLDDSEIAQLIQAAEIHTKTKIIKEAAAGKTGGKKKAASVDDL